MTTEPTSSGTSPDGGESADRSIEDDLQRLGELADQLEDPEIAIEPAVSLYKEGMSLAKRVLSRLDQVEQEVSTLTLDSNDD